MKYCSDCGSLLQIRFHKREKKEMPWCESCGRFKHPMYNTAVSMMVTDEAGKKIILVKQYGRTACNLVAGYVDRGESAEDAVRREVKEELNLDVTGLYFNRTRFFERSNTLMANFTCCVSSLDAQPNDEIDSWGVYSYEEARKAIMPGSLAEQFLLAWMEEHPEPGEE